MSSSRLFTSPTKPLITFIINAVTAHRLKYHSHDPCAPPVFVGLQGPPGIGKSTLAKQIYDHLSSPPNDLLSIFLSLDDLYLTRSDQLKLQEDYPNNSLFHGRGLPGTHDLPLTQRVIYALENVNALRKIQVPRYDKSVHNGLGDRAGFEEITVPKGRKVDLVIFEGWMVGFSPLPSHLLKSLYNDVIQMSKGQNTNSCPFMTRYPVENLIQMNEKLAEYKEKIWPYLGSLITLVPNDFAFVCKWRQQEKQEMKARNGGVGMSDEAVEEFVARYMPCFELYCRQENLPDQCLFQAWQGRGLRVIMDQDRQVLDTTLF
ncbi:hypothetical protein O181_077694 [Austropuccinia psidii MF-1]|uniref:P-loop containing nucleoside triphosphate hydrolase protein n=1 Tax=Austropuccinia psidii MF-1 TaxID=1389203 RepID=A0A9Q3FFF5_9BASI|nr:hypothetical protein [Austropuccinia psidii MF-1]